MLHQNFLKAVDIINNLKNRPTDNELLKLYGLFKQANIGDNNGANDSASTVYVSTSGGSAYEDDFIGKFLPVG